MSTTSNVNGQRHGMNTVLFFVPPFPKGQIEKRKIGELKKLAPLKIGSKLPDKSSEGV